MDFSVFEGLPKWRQTQLKKEYKLFWRFLHVNLRPANPHNAPDPYCSPTRFLVANKNLFSLQPKSIIFATFYEELIACLLYVTQSVHSGRLCLTGSIFVVFVWTCETRKNWDWFTKNRSSWYILIATILTRKEDPHNEVDYLWKKIALFHCSVFLFTAAAVESWFHETGEHNQRWNHLNFNL